MSLWASRARRSEGTAFRGHGVMGSEGKVKWVAGFKEYGVMGFWVQRAHHNKSILSEDTV